MEVLVTVPIPETAQPRHTSHQAVCFLPCLKTFEEQWNMKWLRGEWVAYCIQPSLATEWLYIFVLAPQCSHAVTWYHRAAMTRILTRHKPTFCPNWLLTGFSCGRNGSDGILMLNLFNISIQLLQDLNCISIIIHPAASPPRQLSINLLKLNSSRVIGSCLLLQHPTSFANNSKQIIFHWLSIIRGELGTTHRQKRLQYPGLSLGIRGMWSSDPPVTFLSSPRVGCHECHNMVTQSHH